MKHDLKVTFLLMALFFSAQFVGLFLLNRSISSIEQTESGEINVTYSEPITGRPDLQGQDSFSYTLIMIFIGTMLLLLLIKFRLFKVWKAWFFLAVWGALSISLSVLIPEQYSILFPNDIAIFIGIIFTALKIFRPNVIIHNFTEVFMYGGIAILLSPMFTVFWGIMLLIAISIYDALAVWKLKHMITLATAQAEEKMFAGLLIPYSRKEKTEVKIESKISSKKVEIKKDIPKGFQDKAMKSAILGGGDIAFPMLFAGSVMTWLIQNGNTREMAFFKALLVPFFGGIALFILFLKSKKDTFYPAMPFITVGCLIGYGLVLIL